MNQRSKTKFEIHPLEKFKNWDALVEASPQGTVFSTSLYLDAVGFPYRCYVITKGNQVKAAMCHLVSDDGKLCILDDLVIYNGLMFQNNSCTKETKARSERFKITELVIGYLDRMYQRIELALSPHFEDMRPFLWHNYHSARSSDRFKIDLRYTSYLDITEFSSEKNEEALSLFNNMDTIRKRNLREARQKGGYVERDGSVDLFIEFYKELMKRQSDPQPEKKLCRMKMLIETLMRGGKAVLFSTKNAQNEIIYLIIFVFDRKRAYYLFGAGHPGIMERYQGTLGFWEGFRILSQQYGIREVDMEGVNSPKRGWFKLSFGGRLIPYFQIYKGNK